MKVKQGKVLSEISVIYPTVYADSRGHFFEAFNSLSYKDLGISETFVQDNQSSSRRGVLRGLHYQLQRPQAKLIRVLAGEIFDVAVDIRVGSPTFAKWEGFHLDAENLKQVWIPKGFAHGFFVLSETATILYKTSDFYCPEDERVIRWDDSELNIAWPHSDEGFLVSDKDKAGISLRDAQLPSYV